MSKRKLNIGVIGLGRIGKIHLKNLERHPLVSQIFLVKRGQIKEEKFAQKYTIYQDYKEMIDRRDIDGVLICSPTPSHGEIMEYCCKKQKHIFCEKPVDLKIEKVKWLRDKVLDAYIQCQVGFNRRFDPHFSALKSRIKADGVGQIQQIIITSRDPGFPSMSYLETSGGMFLDQTIHDFDMARFLIDSKIKSVFTIGQVLIDAQILQYDDIDTATTVLEFENGATCTIFNSRQSNYGYDQRIEVFGSKGMLQVHNQQENKIQHWTASGVTSAIPQNFFLQRYAKSYEIEIDHFLQCISGGQNVGVGMDDAIQASAIAELALQSHKQKRIITT